MARYWLTTQSMGRTARGCSGKAFGANAGGGAAASFAFAPGHEPPEERIFQNVHTLTDTASCPKGLPEHLDRLGGSKDDEQQSDAQGHIIECC